MVREARLWCWFLHFSLLCGVGFPSWVVLLSLPSLCMVLLSLPSCFVPPPWSGAAVPTLKLDVKFDGIM